MQGLEKAKLKGFLSLKAVSSEDPTQHCFRSNSCPCDVDSAKLRKQGASCLGHTGRKTTGTNGQTPMLALPPMQEAFLQSTHVGPWPLSPRGLLQLVTVLRPTIRPLRGRTAWVNS